MLASLEERITTKNVQDALRVLQNVPDSLMQQAVGGMGLTQKAFPAASPTHIMGHDAGGLFNSPATEQRLFSAMVLPRRGLQDFLPLFPSRFTNPQIEVITGVSDSTGTEPDGVCDDPPTAGDLEKCIIYNYPFGRFSRQTKVIDVSAIGKLENRADFTDRIVAGSPFRTATTVNRPSMPGAEDLQGAVNAEIQKAIVPFAISMQRDFSRLFYTGDPVNNSANGGYKEYRGLDSLINNDYNSLVTGAACDRVDSYIASFSDLAIEANAETYVRQIVEMVNFLVRRSEAMGLDPARFALVMPYNLFRVSVFLWASTYMSYRLQVGGTNVRGNLSGEMLMNQTLDMLRNKYLEIDNGRIPVICDESIVETDVGGGVYESEVKFVPLDVLGGSVPATYMEYFDFTGPDAAQRGMQLLGGNLTSYYRWFDNGRFFAHYKPPNNWCIQMMVLTESRLRLDIPWLAARLTDVRYTPIIPEESAFPGDAAYVTGGTPGPLPGALGTESSITACADNAPGDLTFTLDKVLNCTLGTNVLVIVGNTQIPAVISAGNNSTSVTVDFTTAATPTPLQAVTCASLTFVGGTIRCNF